MKFFNKLVKHPIAALLIVLIIATVAFAARYESLDVTKLYVTSISPKGTATYWTATGMRSSATREVQIPISNFYIEGGSTQETIGTLGYTLPTIVAVGGVSILATGNTNVLSFADAGYSAVTTTFKVPDDYLSGGSFKVLTSLSYGALYSTPPCLDFGVLVNGSGSAVDSAFTNQSYVRQASDNTAGATPYLMTLTVSTDFSSLTSAKWITLRLWKAETAGAGALDCTGSASLHVRGVTFVYTSSN